MHRDPQDIFELIGRAGQVERMADAMRAIAHPLRLKVLCVLGENDMRVRDLVEAVGTSQSNVSQHLAILRKKNILGTRKIANHVYYSVTDPRVLQLVCTMREVLCGPPD
jgi:DNA-binding transcriptional ArsR family regulator